MGAPVRPNMFEHWLIRPWQKNDAVYTASQKSNSTRGCSRTATRFGEVGKLVRFMAAPFQCREVQGDARRLQGPKRGKIIISGTERNGGTHCDWPVDGIGHR